MRLQLESEQPKRQRDSSQDAHVEQQAGAQDPGEPKKSKSKLVLDTAEAQGLPEREFRHRLNRLEENPLFQKLKRLGVIRGKYFRGEMKREELDEITVEEMGTIAEIMERYGISQADYKEFFFNPNGEEFDLGKTAKKFNMSREDAYRLFRLSQEAKSYYYPRESDDREAGWNEEHAGHSLTSEQGRQIKGSVTYTDTENGQVKRRKIEELHSTESSPATPGTNIPVAEITESGEVTILKPAGPRGKWIFSMRGSSQRLNEVRELDFIDEEEYKEARGMLGELQILNNARTQQRQILEVIARDSKGYLSSGKYEDIKICTMKEIAKEIGIADSTVSLVVKKTVKTPHGTEYLRMFTGNKGILANIMINQIIAEAGSKKPQEIANIITKRFQNSEVNKNVKVSRQFISSKMPVKKKQEGLHDKSRKSRKVNAYIEKIPEEERSSLRKEGAEDPPSRIKNSNYIVWKVIAHFIDSIIPQEATDDNWPTDPEIREAIKNELNLNVSESTIRKYKKEAKILSPRQREREKEKLRREQEEWEMRQIADGLLR